MSPKRLETSKIGKASDQLQPLPQKFGKLWSTNKKVINTHVDPTKIKFSGRLYFGSLEVAAP